MPASAIRWCGAASVTIVVTMSPGRTCGVAGVEVHQPAVAGPPAHPRGAAVLAPFARGDQQFDGLPICARFSSSEISSCSAISRS